MTTLDSGPSDKSFENLGVPSLPRDFRRNDKIGFFSHVEERMCFQNDWLGTMIVC